MFLDVAADPIAEMTGASAPDAAGTGAALLRRKDMAVAILPASREERIEFFETRLSAWTTHAVAVGLNAPGMLQFTSLVTAARDAYTAALVAREASKSATQAFHNACAKMDTPGRDSIATIKAFAETTADPNVYVLAQIPPPAAPAPAPAPDAPTDLRASIDASGTLTLAWDAVRSGATAGIVFLVSRKEATETAFTFIGATFDKSYIDPAFAACAGPIAYRVQAQRGELFSGFAGPIEINLGGGGTLTTTAGFVGGNQGVTAEAA